ncbi:hypothetical protein [Endozoicomonas sp. ALB091]|uniref:hypothetical protein n=1 Tax=Endozoicomonas sp. ALB091 TaxID=3403073 RepID=UPI003BB7DBB0
MDNYDGAGWTDWMLLKELDRASIPDQPGVCMIAAHRRIHRAHGTDKQGILDIGESDNLKKRLAAFRACSLGHRNRGHTQQAGDATISTLTAYSPMKNYGYAGKHVGEKRKLMPLRVNFYRPIFRSIMNSLR